MVRVPKLRQVIKWKFVYHGIFWARYVVAVSISQLMVQISVRIFWPEFVEGRGGIFVMYSMHEGHVSF